MGMWKAPGQNNMLTGQQNAYGSDPTRPEGLAKSSPSIARYPAAGAPQPKPVAYQDPYASIISQKAQQIDAGASRAPTQGQQMKQSAMQPTGGDVPGIGAPQAGALAHAGAKTMAAPAAAAQAPMVPAVSAQQIQDMKQGAFKQMQAGPQQVMQGGPMYAGMGHANAPGQTDTTGEYGNYSNYENQPNQMASGGGTNNHPDGGLNSLLDENGNPKTPVPTQTSKVGLTKEQQDELNNFMMDQVMNSSYGIPDEVVKQKLASINEGLEKQAGADKQQAGFMMGASGLAGSGMSTSVLSGIDAKKMQAMKEAETTMYLDNAKMAQQEKMQRISDAIQMAQMQGNWDLAERLQAEQMKLQREQMNLEFMVQYPQTAYAFKKEAGMSDADWQLYQADMGKIDMGSADAPKQVAELASNWIRDEAGVPHYKPKGGAKPAGASGAAPSPEIAAPPGQTTNWKDLTPQQQDGLKSKYYDWLKTKPKPTVEIGELPNGEKQYVVMNFEQWLEANGYTV